MRTIKEWFATLPDDIRERAYKYTEKDMLEFLEPTLFEAILGAFILSDTLEGRDFWTLVAMGKFDEALELLTNNTTKP